MFSLIFLRFACLLCFLELRATSSPLDIHATLPFTASYEGSSVETSKSKRHNNSSAANGASIPSNTVFCYDLNFHSLHVNFPLCQGLLDYLRGFPDYYTPRIWTGAGRRRRWTRAVGTCQMSIWNERVGATDTFSIAVAAGKIENILDRCRDTEHMVNLGGQTEVRYNGFSVNVVGIDPRSTSQVALPGDGNSSVISRSLSPSLVERAFTPTQLPAALAPLSTFPPPSFDTTNTVHCYDTPQATIRVTRRECTPIITYLQHLPEYTH